ncbi:hypothetical protein C1703_00360 [Streptomyces sp. Go-475]|nr:hypothetical protein C1703_00360 [Streptomyces sp. Go-475]
MRAGLTVPAGRACSTLRTFRSSVSLALSFRAIRRRALRTAKPPARGGDAQRVFLRRDHLDLDPPLDWKVFGDSYHIG